MSLHNRLWQFVLNRAWYTARPITFLAQAPPDECLAMLRQAVKPRKEQLHLQELFTDGRRYAVEPRRFGFVLLTNSKGYWRYTESTFGVRRRTRSSARMLGTLTEVTDNYTRLELRSHIRMGYLLDVLVIPTFMASLVVLMPWAVWLIVAITVTLYVLSYIYHYYNASFQANEMAFFVEKVLMDKLVTNLPTLGATNPDLVQTTQDFEQEWERFYNARKPRE